MDRLSHSVHRSGHAIDLSPKEFALLEFLMRHSGHPVSRATIVEQVWAAERGDDDQRRGRVCQLFTAKSRF